MSFRIRLGPFTTGRSGTRVSLWRRGTGYSKPLGKGKGFGRLKLGIFSWWFKK